MTKINILSPMLADMIAAGEVVERPASVIKELMENAFDAGAKKICVDFKDGGSTYIRVTDDGCGMSPEDAGIAFMRHATSKLKDERSLEAIGTMGFRGEALAAISAVSRIELITREKGTDEGTRLTLEAGDIKEMLPCGCPEGTSITIRDIFFNTPARRKFLKSDRAEASACLTTALRCALGRPEVSVRCTRDGEDEFFTPGDGRDDSTVYSLLGRETAGTLLPVKSSEGSVSVRGFVSSPSAGRGSRSQQYFYCNGRFIKSSLLQAAVEQAYKNSLLTGRFPACVIFLEMNRSSVDVNVHPAKTEVKFSDEKKIFDIVYQTVKTALEGEEKPAQIRLSESTKKAISEPKPDFFKSMSSQVYRDYSKQQEKISVPRKEQDFYETAPLRAPEPSYNRTPVYSPQNNFTGKPEKIVEKPAEKAEIIPDKKPRVIGEALNTYILLEKDSELLLIDKHAAHERMIFDRLKAQSRQIMSQSLIDPLIIRPDASDAELIENNGELLSELGFELEPYGDRDFALRAIPDDIDIGDASAAIEEICEKLRRGRDLSPENARDEILHTVACKAAIKAGRSHDRAELERIANAVCAGEVKYCPHGRPVSVSLSKKELDKFFSRTV